MLLQLNREPTTIAEGRPSLWYNLHNPSNVGLATPVKELLEKLKSLDPLF